MPIKKTREQMLTQKERLLVAGVVSGKKIKDASLDAGYRPETGSEMLRRPHVRIALNHALRKAGLSDQLITQKLREGLDAVRLTADGKELPDYPTRAKYLKICLKVTGDYAPEKLDIRTDQPIVQNTTIVEFSLEAVTEYWKNKIANREVNQPLIENKKIEEEEKFS